MNWQEYLRSFPIGATMQYFYYMNFRNRSHNTIGKYFSDTFSQFYKKTLLVLLYYIFQPFFEFLLNHNILTKLEQLLKLELENSTYEQLSKIQHTLDLEFSQYLSITNVSSKFLNHSRLYNFIQSVSFYILNLDAVYV